MKTLIVAVGIAVAMGVAVRYMPNTAEVMKSTPETIVKVEKVDTLEDRIKNAQEAEIDTVQSKAQAAYDAVYDDEMNQISDDEVKTQYISEIESTITSEDY